MKTAQWHLHGCRVQGFGCGNPEANRSSWDEAVHWSGLVGTVALLMAVLCYAPTALEAQEDLEQAIQAAQQSWLSHDMSALVAESDTVRLRIPGIAPSASLKPGQASTLLEQYVKSADEKSCKRTGLRELAEDHVYAEVQRVYVVKGTHQERSETILFGFRRISGIWRLREVRVTP